MSFGVIPIFWLEILRVLEKKAKKRNQENLAFTGPFAAAKGTLAVAKCFAIEKGFLVVARPKGQKRPPSGSPRRSHCSYWANFRFLFPNTSYSYPDSLRTLIND